MITKIFNYHLRQPIKEAEGLTEFTDEEYSEFNSAGIKRTLRNEKFYNSPDINFMGGTWDLVIGSTDDIIYKISAQNMTNDKSLSDDIFNKILKESVAEMGKHSEHQMMSKKYIWDSKDGNVLLNQVSKMGFICINFILTSSVIRDQARIETVF